jgi:NACHT domain/Domain of unknown function (DUF4062)
VSRAQIFLSAVSAEFRSYRDRLRHDLTRPNVSVAVQEDFIVTGTETLDMLDDYVRQCDAVIHLVGDMTGARAQAPSLAAIRQRYPDLGERLPPLAPFLQPGAAALSYTQWEAWLALYHGKPLIIAVPEDNAPRDERYERNSEQSAAQQAHVKRLAELERYPFRFANADRLAVEVLRSKLHEILARADPPTRLAPSLAPSMNPDLLTLLRTVKRDWIEGVRANSLDKIVQLELGKESYARAIDHPWGEVIELGDQRAQPLPPNTGILDIFRRAGDFLLILGEPGSGKTMTLLDLTSDLIAETETDPSKPIPIVLNLSTWKESDSDLNSWISGELKSKYFVQERLGMKWLKESRLLLMLDGLDEVKASARAQCVKAINVFLEEFSPRGMVVSCRFTEYENLPMRLRFKGAIKLLPLTTEQIDQSLAATGLEAIRGAVQGDAQLRELARTPLVLNIMVMAYKDEKRDAVPIETNVNRDQLTKNLMDRYIAKMFGRKGSASKQPYTQETVRHSLSWLAQHLVERSQTVFLIESLQPDWLAHRAGRMLYWMGTRGFWALAYAAIAFFVSPGGSSSRANAFQSVSPVIFALALTSGLLDGFFYDQKGKGNTDSRMALALRIVLRWLLYIGAFGVCGSFVFFLNPTIGDVSFKEILNQLYSDNKDIFALVVINNMILYSTVILAYRSVRRDTIGDVRTVTGGWTRAKVERGYIWGILCYVFFLTFGMVSATLVLSIDSHTEKSVLGIPNFEGRTTFFVLESCALFIFLVAPYLRRRVRQDMKETSFLSRMGMDSYVSATIRLVLASLVFVSGVLGARYLSSEGLPNLSTTKVLTGIFLSVGMLVSCGIFFGGMGILLNQLKGNAITTSPASPNEGIKMTFRHALFSSCLIAIIWLPWMVPSLFGDDTELARGSLFLLVLTSGIVGLWYGGAVLRHFTLRFILYRQGCIPKDFVRFLDYSTNLIFLRKVGGGYVFIHRLVMEHFASLKNTPPQLLPAAKIATEK